MKAHYIVEDRGEIKDIEKALGMPVEYNGRWAKANTAKHIQDLVHHLLREASGVLVHLTMTKT